MPVQFWKYKTQMPMRKVGRSAGKILQARDKKVDKLTNMEIEFVNL
jgi:hypothetical protein